MDTVDKLSSEAAAGLEKRAAEKASECNAAPKPFVDVAGPKLASYFGQFSSATVRPVFVIYKRELVDATVLLLGFTGKVVKTSPQSMSLLAADFAKVNNPYEADADIGPIYAALMYSAPLSNFTCLDMKRAVVAADEREVPALVESPTFGASSAGGAVSSPVEPNLCETLWGPRDRKN